jgi:hypothetical protein
MRNYQRRDNKFMLIRPSRLGQEEKFVCAGPYEIRSMLEDL